MGFLDYRASAGFLTRCDGKLREPFVWHTKGYASGQMELRTSWDGEVIGTFPIGYANVWHDTEAKITIPDGIQSLYFTFTGQGHLQFAGFTLN